MLVSILWAVKIFEGVANTDLSVLGILPRTLEGTIGIIASPFIHGDYLHLITNTFPLLFLGVALFYFYDRIALQVLLIIYLLSGFWVWIMARDAYHIGASGVVYGLMSFMLFSGFIRRDSKTMAISFIIMLLYGGSLFTGLIPAENGVSWESHLSGFLIGIVCAIYFKGYKRDVDETEEAEYSGRVSTTGKFGDYTFTDNKDPEESDEDNDFTYRYIYKPTRKRR